jgi:hypothetical protein
VKAVSSASGVSYRPAHRFGSGETGGAGAGFGGFGGRGSWRGLGSPLILSRIDRSESGPPT